MDNVVNYLLDISKAVRNIYTLLVCKIDTIITALEREQEENSCDLPQYVQQCQPWEVKLVQDVVQKPCQHQILCDDTVIIDRVVCYDNVGNIQNVTYKYLDGTLYLGNILNLTSCLDCQVIPISTNVHYIDNNECVNATKFQFWDCEQTLIATKYYTFEGIDITAANFISVEGECSTCAPVLWSTTVTADTVLTYTSGANEVYVYPTTSCCNYDITLLGVTIPIQGREIQFTFDCPIITEITLTNVTCELQVIALKK